MKMKSAISRVASCAAACALASVVASPASGTQAGRRGIGNSAEIERLERERREREMLERDLRERQALLRALGSEGGRAPAARPEPRLPVAKIREDFLRLQVVNNDLARAVHAGGALDLKFVSKSASEIRKLAARLKENLALPETEKDADGARAEAARGPAQLNEALSTLDGLILQFADGLASGGVNEVDARSSGKARRELEGIIELSGWVKKACERMGKAGARPR